MGSLQCPADFLSVSNQLVDELTTLRLTNSATDFDLPPEALTFSLVSAPSGMVLTPSSTNLAVVAWT
jgi:hypothetical protein